MKMATKNGVRRIELQVREKEALRNAFDVLTDLHFTGPCIDTNAALVAIETIIAKYCNKDHEESVKSTADPCPQTPEEIAKDVLGNQPYESIASTGV